MLRAVLLATSARQTSEQEFQALARQTPEQGAIVQRTVQDTDQCLPQQVEPHQGVEAVYLTMATSVAA